MDRPIDFFRDRNMVCEACEHFWVADLDWIDEWEQARTVCPGCGITCEEESAPRVTVAPDDLALIDSDVPLLYWYHTSTIADWPCELFDPGAKLTDELREAMGGHEQVDIWAQRQRSKALHVGTYESAIHNMLRRITDQADHGKQFYLYRVYLRATIELREGWLIDPSDWVGDVILNEICPPGTDAVRYLNYHEDPGGLSLAISRNAVAKTQRIPIPLKPFGSKDPATLTQRLPVNLRRHFQASASQSGAAESPDWQHSVRGIAGLVLDFEGTLGELDAQCAAPPA